MKKDNLQHNYANELVRSLLVPSLVLLIASFVLSIIWKSLGYEGVTKVFFEKLVQWMPVGVSVLLLVILGLAWLAKQPAFRPTSEDKPYPWHTTIFFLIPLLSVVQYIFNNREILDMAARIAMLGFAILFSAIFILVIPLILRKTGSTSQLIALGTAFSWLIFQMAVFTKRFNWFEQGSILIQSAILGIASLVIFLLSKIKEKGLMVFLVSAFFFGTIAAHYFVANKTSEKTSNLGKLDLLNKISSPIRKPDVYLMIYDSYVSNETMLGYGIDNSAQEQKLMDLGFTLYPSTYSIGAASLQTMRIVLDLSLDHENVDRGGVSGDGIVQQAFKKIGYETYGIFESDYMFKGTESTYDYSVPGKARSQAFVMIEAMLIGEFRFDQGYDTQTHLDYLTKKQELLSEQNKTPRFIYFHTELPNHSQNSGACLENETELYKQHLDKANIEMIDDLTVALASNPGAIIIVAGDHGPYLTKNCYLTLGDYEASEINRLDIQDRYGTFLAIRWPQNFQGKREDIQIIQDLFPAIFAYLYNDDSFLSYRLNQKTLFTYSISDAYVEDGIIHGGVNDGEPLFINQNN